MPSLRQTQTSLEETPSSLSTKALLANHTNSPWGGRSLRDFAWWNSEFSPQQKTLCFTSYASPSWGKHSLRDIAWWNSEFPLILSIVRWFYWVYEIYFPVKESFIAWPAVTTIRSHVNHVVVKDTSACSHITVLKRNAVAGPINQWD
jgi:hypothetical protein